MSARVNLTIPVYRAPTSSLELGCGYFDAADNVFKQTGIESLAYDSANLKVTCRTSHFTAFGVEEYKAPIVGTNQTGYIGTTDTQPALISESYAFYLIFVLYLALVLGILWGRRRDNVDRVKGVPNQLILYGLYLDKAPQDNPADEEVLQQENFKEEKPKPEDNI